MIGLPTVDTPPDIFGTRDNPQSDILIDPNTCELRTATIALTYFTKAGTAGAVGDQTE